MKLGTKHLKLPAKLMLSTLPLLLLALSAPQVVAQTPTNSPVVRPNPSDAFGAASSQVQYHELADGQLAPLYSTTLDCSSYCFASYFYTQSGPYVEMTSTITEPYPPSQSLGTSSYTDFWIGLQECDPNGSCSSPNNVLVQAGTNFGDDGDSWNTPTVFIEIIGPTTWNGINCETSFCGKFMSVSSGVTMQLSAYLSSGNWYAVAHDDGNGNQISMDISATSLGVSSLGYAISTFEGNGLSSQAQMDRYPPIDMTNIVIYNSSGQIGINPSDWQAFYTPTSSSGISISDTLEGAGWTEWDYST